MNNAAAEPHPARRYLLLAVKLAVSIVLLTILFSRIDAGRLWSSARQASIARLPCTVGHLASFWMFREEIRDQQTG